MKLAKLFSIPILMSLVLTSLQCSSSNEDDKYVLVKIKYANNLTSVTIKKVPSDLCTAKLEETATQGLKGCGQCELTQKECLSQMPSEYTGIFENAKISQPYIAIDVKYPERHIMIDPPEGVFNKMCEAMKEKRPSTICVP